MARKNRSQRRKNNDKDTSSSSANEENQSILPDDHTIADSISTLQSLHDEFSAKEDGDEEYDISQAAIRHSKVIDVLNTISEFASEKRSSRREQNLRSLFKAMTQYTSTNTTRELIILNAEEIIFPATLYSLRNSSSSSSEQYAACRCLEVSCILLGEEKHSMEDLFTTSIDPLLKKIIRATGMATQVRIAAIRALSMSYLMGYHCGIDSIIEIHHFMDFCELVCANKFRGEFVNELLRANAIECWTLMATVLSNSDLAGNLISPIYSNGDSSNGNGYDHGHETEGDDGDYYDSGEGGRGVAMLPLFLKCLEESNCMELKSACGEAVALIHESRLDLGIGDDEEVNVTQRRFEKGSWEGSEHEVTIDELKQLVSELSLTTGHHMSKKAKKEQRATFREIQCTLVEDESPSECMNISGISVDLTSWKDIIQLNFIRHCLQSGFQIQFLYNEILWNIFGLDGKEIMANQGVSGGGLSRFEKRMTMGKTSEAAKAADRHLVKKRRNRNQAKHSFLTADDDE